jgi:hypothetical protein
VVVASSFCRDCNRECGRAYVVEVKARMADVKAAKERIVYVPTSWRIVDAGFGWERMISESFEYESQQACIVNDMVDSSSFQEEE